jgi:hypothetical protein
MFRSAIEAAIASTQVEWRCAVNSAGHSTLSTGMRVVLWFVSLLTAVACFSVFLSLWLTTAESAKAGLIVPIFRMTMMCALPIWCLCLPLVIAMKNTEGWRMWTILLTGSLLGPLLVGLWFLLLELGGASQPMVWQGDPQLGWAGRSIAGMFFALIVGLLTTSTYLIAIKLLHRRSVSADHRSASI